MDSIYLKDEKAEDQEVPGIQSGDDMIQEISQMEDMKNEGVKI